MGRGRMNPATASMVDHIRREVRRRREALGLSQVDLGARMGVADSYISHIERGRTPNMQIDSLARLAEALECQPQDLLADRRPQTTRDIVIELVLLATDLLRKTTEEAK